MTSRRDFIKGAVLAGVGGVVPGCCASAPRDPSGRGETALIPIVDTHQHMWDLGRFELPWTKDEKPLARNFLMSDYLEASSGLNVVKTVYMEVDVTPSQQVKEAEHVVEMCRRDDNPMSGAVISGRPSSDGFRDYITAFKDTPEIKGVRRILQVGETPPGHCLGDKFVESVRLVGELGMSFDLCMRHGEISDAAKLAAACPDTQLVLDHCGNAEVHSADRSKWLRDIAALAEKKNVACKISGFVATAKKGEWKTEDLAPVIRHCYESFGPDRVVFGSDWPVCNLSASYKSWVGALKEVMKGESEEHRRKLFHDNAIRVYRLG
ncbi:MAG: amidohydrolase family protein [Planctomycetota bacterium]